MALATLEPPANPLPTSTLNPAQREVLELLGSRPDERRPFDPDLRAEVLADLEDGLRPLLDGLPGDDRLFLSKYPLGQVHGCEARFLADDGAPFEWSPSTARGAVAHKAVELSVHWPTTPDALSLVDEAVGRLTAGGGGLADYLRSAPMAEVAELRGDANERVSKFLECFPRLKAAWWPVTESLVRVELFAGRIVLQGRVDLTLGKARGTTAGKVLIDLKTGGFAPHHAEDLRFYALLETIRLGTPPNRLATYYLDSGRPHPEPVTPDTLRAAVRRTVDGAQRIVELRHHDHPPVRRPGPACRWCPLLADCETGRALLDDDPAASPVALGHG